jgi:hypothetical protein
MRLSTQHHPAQEGTFPVKSSSPRPRTITVTTDGKGIVNHAGAAALRQLADRLGFSQAASLGLRTVRQRRGRHDPGAVLTDLVVSIADGGDCLSDLVALLEQPRLFGQVASTATATAWRLVDAIGERELGRLADARRQARARAWAAAGAPEQIVLTPEGHVALSKIETAHRTWADALGAEIGESKLRKASAVLDAVLDAVEHSSGARPGDNPEGPFRG